MIKLTWARFWPARNHGIRRSAPQAVLSSALAQEIVTACFKGRAEQLFNVNVFVLDDGGHLLSAAQDDACKACAAIAENKAITSGLYGAPTRVMADLSFGKTVMVTRAFPARRSCPASLPLQAACPSTPRASVIGGIGVSGAATTRRTMRSGWDRRDSAAIRPVCERILRSAYPRRCPAL